MLMQRVSLELCMWVNVLKEGLLPSQDPYMIVTEVVGYNEAGEDGKTAAACRQS